MGLLEPVPFYAIGAIVVIEIMDFTFAFLVAELARGNKIKGCTMLKSRAKRQNLKRILSFLPKIRG